MKGEPSDRPADGHRDSRKVGEGPVPAPNVWCVIVESADRRYPGPMRLYYHTERAALERVGNADKLGQTVLGLWKGETVWEEQTWTYG